MFARNDVRSSAAAASHFRLWKAFSSASFRRKIINTVSCGGSYHRRDAGELPEEKPKSADLKQWSECRSEPKKTGRGSEKLSDLLRLSRCSEQELAMETGEEVRRKKKKMESFEELKGVVKKFQSDEFLVGAMDVRRLAKDDSEARTTLALLGAIPPLVALLDSNDLKTQIASLYALLNLGIGNNANKAAIVKAGAVHKMLNLVESPPNGCADPAVSEAIVANFLGLSALDSNKPIIGSSGAIPFLVSILKDLDNKSGPQAKQDSLRGLYNLSIAHSNIPPMLETDLIPFLLNALGDEEASDRILSLLSNLVSTPEGRKAVSIVPDAFEVLIDVLSWTDSPGCQEKAAYILMVMAHKAYGDRQTMIQAGIVSALLELTLLGTALAQKRASRILECLRIEKGKQVSESFGEGSRCAAVVSAPVGGSSWSSFSKGEEEMMSEERKAVKKLVQQSLQNNMRRIVKRANLAQDFVPSNHFKSLTMSSTSKSLPF